MLNQGFTDLIRKEPQILYFDFVLHVHVGKDTKGLCQYPLRLQSTPI